MHPRNILLVAFSVAVLGALVLLLVKVNAGAAVDVPEEALNEARARYARSQAARNRRSPAPPAASNAAAAAAARALRARKEAEQARSSSGRTPPEPRRPPARLPPQEARREDSPREQDLASQRQELRSAYDRGNYELALQYAKGYLRERPNDRYVMRVTVTSACAAGDEETARAIYEQMIEEDRRIERLRCAKYGVEF